MRILAINLVTGLTFLLGAAAAHADATNETMQFAVMRNNNQIGTNTISIGHNGPETRVQIVTHVSVGFAFLTLYKFDQTEIEQWNDGRFVGLSAQTNDNGTVHRVSANNRDGVLIVDDNGKVRNEAASALPISLWSPALPENGLGLDPEDGSTTPVSVVDRGEDDIVVAGRAERAHHFLVKTAFTQDVWYDAQNRLVQVEMRGRDGSTISYKLM